MIIYFKIGKLKDILADLHNINNEKKWDLFNIIEFKNIERI